MAVSFDGTCERVSYPSVIVLPAPRHRPGPERRITKMVRGDARLTVLTCCLLKRNPLPFLMAEAMLSNIGGFASLMTIGVGGNGSHVGATANLIVISESESCGIEGARISPGRWLRTGLPVTLISLLLASGGFALFF